MFIWGQYVRLVCFTMSSSLNNDIIIIIIIIRTSHIGDQHWWSVPMVGNGHRTLVYANMAASVWRKISERMRWVEVAESHSPNFQIKKK